MKFKFLAFAFSLLALSSQAVEAKKQNVVSFKQKAFPSAKSKSANFSFYSASDNSAIQFEGSPTATFQQIPFTQHVHVNGKGIKASANGQVFHLSKGEYLVTFTGTFDNFVGEAVFIGSVTSIYDIALQLNNSFVFINTDSVTVTDELGDDGDVAISSISQIVRVKGDLDLSIVARNKTSFAPLTVATRSLSIIKLK